jgi:hypothetical protein
MRSVIRVRLVGMPALFVLLAIMALIMVNLSGCSTTQCANGQKALASAQVAYDAALLSGNAKQIQQYRWTLDAAQAIVTIWCSTQSETTVLRW